MLSSDTGSSEDSDYVYRKKKYILLYLKHRKKRARRTFWLCQHIRERTLKEEYRLFYDLDDEKFNNYYRVSREQFQELLSFVEADILKQNTNYRKAIPPQEKLAVCLR
ncbi:unnamed protein product [Pieris macdunnoughi]|uniref:Uncharacterized protein n=1 Tax=Pieris macdunnoughi TaxID=345717 RepID=A0A821XMQ1_9NEOP|nr:unnamed protein product [Pieris macdunnoughi]